MNEQTGNCCHGNCAPHTCFTNGDSLCVCETEIRLKNESEALSETCSVLGIIKTPNVFKM